MKAFAAFASVGLVVTLVIACSDSGDDTDDEETSTPTGAFPTCKGATTSDAGQSSSSCTEAELKPYADCVNTACEPKYKECAGANYKQGDFTGGACSDYYKCLTGCSCTDANCKSRCNLAGACQDCILGLASCGQSCKLPACAQVAVEPDAAPAKGCADLLACCNKLSGAEKDQCTTTHTNAGGSDIACNAYYTALKCS